MPYPNTHSARVADPSKFEKDSFRTKEIAPGISIIMGKMMGSDSMVAQSYRFDASKFTAEEAKKWMEEHHIKMMEFSAATAIHSTLTEKPKIDNGIWIPFMRDGQLAEDNNGKRYRITKSAIDAGYKSYLGGFINVNHQDKIRGKIVDVKREGEFAYAKAEGLDEEALAVINSPAYRGVSQQSLNLKAIPGSDDMTDVLELQGQGLAIALYPKQPGCPIKDGCGIPIASTLQIELHKPEPIISLNTDTSKLELTKPEIIGGLKSTMTEYTQEQIKDMTTFLGAHPEKIPTELKSILVETAAPVPANIASTKSADEQIAQLKQDLLNERKASTYALTSALQSTLAEREAEMALKLKAEGEYQNIVTGLYSCMSRSSVDKLIKDNEGYPLATKTSILKSVLEVVQGSGAARVGVATGIEMRSTVQFKDRMTALHIPSIEFTHGGE